MIKSVISITNCFKLILSEGPLFGSESRKPGRQWVDRDSEFYKKKKHLYRYLKKIREKYYSYRDLQNIFIEQFNRTLKHLNNKSKFINDDCNWVIY